MINWLPNQGQFMNKTIPQSAYTPAKSWQMFDQISNHYDLLNRLLSLGLDKNWRRELKYYLPEGTDLSLLDLATGTGDVLLTLIKAPSIATGHGIDLSKNMLQAAQDKITNTGLRSQLTVSEGDAAQIPFENGKFDVVTISFGIRNTESPQKVLSEIFRVLKKNGRALILEFSLPANPVLRSLALFYLRTIVPGIGGLISGNAEAYRYLNRTIEQFPCGESFCDLMQEAGFRIVRFDPLTFGIATIYQGTK